MTKEDISSEARRTGSAEDFVPIYGFTNRAFITRGGEPGMVLRIRGAEYECLDPEDLERAAKQLENSLRPFDHDYILYQYLFRSEGAVVPRQESYPHPMVEYAVRERILALAGCHTVEAYFVILFSRYRRPQTRWERLQHRVRSWVSERATGVSIEAEIYAAQHEMAAAVEGFVQRMQEHGGFEVLARKEMVRFFRRLLNPDPELAERYPLRWSYPAARQLADSPLEAHRHHLIVGRSHYTRLLTMKDPPEVLPANALRRLVETEASMIVVTEWRRQTSAAALKAIKRAKQHVLTLGSVEVLKGLFQAFRNVPMSKEAADDAGQSEKTTAALLEEAKSAIANDGTGFGLFSLSVMVREDSEAKLEHALARIQKALGDIGMTVYDETLGLTRQYFACIPGNGRFNRRLQWLSSDNYAALSFLFLPQRGEPKTERLNGEYLIPLRTRQNTVSLMNLHYGSSPHVFICGVNDSGKSFTTNALITHAQKHSPRTLILDIGGSYREIASRFDGGYLDLAPGKMQVKINPFSLPPTMHNLHFLYSFVRVLAESGGEYKLTDAVRSDVFSRIAGLYDMDPGDRTLGNLYWMVPVPLREHLAQWVRSDAQHRAGRYGHVFDNAEDTLTLREFQALDFQGMEDMPELAEPVLFYILHRQRAHVYAEPRRHKLMVMDEAWRFLRGQIVRDYVESAMKTWRKHNAAFVLVTQSPHDVVKAGMDPVIAEALTRLLLPNPAADEAVYRRLFPGINRAQLNMIPAMRKKQEFLLLKPGLARVLQLNASPAEIDLFASTPEREEERQTV